MTEFSARNGSFPRLLLTIGSLQGGGAERQLSDMANYWARHGAQVTLATWSGPNVEDFYCPGLEWNWGDGARSVRESDCPPFEPGREFERRFSAEHDYRHAGDYEITITLRRANRSLAVASARVNVRPGLGDVSAP